MHYLFKGKLYKIYASSLLLGIIGYVLGMYKIKIPFYLDTSLTCMPFICVGMMIRKNTNLLTCKEGSRSYNLIFSLICFLVVCALCRGGNMFYLNEYDNSYFSVLLTGVSGSLGVILLCKTIVKIPVISYIGRYSIIVLGVHTIIIDEMDFCQNVFTQLIFWEIATLVAVVVVSCGLIHLFIRYIPFFVAQKDFVRFVFPQK